MRRRQRQGDAVVIRQQPAGSRLVAQPAGPTEWSAWFVFYSALRTMFDTDDQNET